MEVVDNANWQAKIVSIYIFLFSVEESASLQGTGIVFP